LSDDFIFGEPDQIPDSCSDIHNVRVAELPCIAALPQLHALQYINT
jgi:hypothetical protein